MCQAVFLNHVFYLDCFGLPLPAARRPDRTGPVYALSQNATVRENILFGVPFDEQRYRRAVRYCELDRDLDVLLVCGAEGCCF